MAVLAGRSNDPARGGQPERPRQRGCRRSWVGVLHGPLDAIRKSHDTLQRIATERLPSYGNRSVASRACPGAVGSGQAGDLARRCCFANDLLSKRSIGLAGRLDEEQPCADRAAKRARHRGGDQPVQATTGLEQEGEPGEPTSTAVTASGENFSM